MGEHAADRAVANYPFFDTPDCGVSALRIVEMRVIGLYQKKGVVVCLLDSDLCDNFYFQPIHTKNLKESCH